jgi:hypothetical protein
LTKILLETKQEVPDFLQQYMPEEGVALRFQADSDEDEENTDGGDTGAAWAAKTEYVSAQVAVVPGGVAGWGRPAAESAPAPTVAAVSGWGPAAMAQVTTPMSGGGWGEPAPAPKVAPRAAEPVSMAAVRGWGASAPAPAPKVAQPAANSVGGGWGAPAAKMVQPVATNAGGGWGASAQPAATKAPGAVKPSAPAAAAFDLWETKSVVSPGWNAQGNDDSGW